VLGLLPFPFEEIEDSLPARFARVAANRSSALAISHGSLRLTYAEVDHRSDAIAAAIGRRVPAPRAPVAVVVADPADAICALMATWKAGKLCVPLDPDHPPEYLRALVRDTEAALLVVDGAGGKALGAGAAPPRLDVDEVDRAGELPRPAILPGDPACLQFTSGSTGAPKGVLRSHRCVLYRMQRFVTSHGVRSADRVSLLHPLSFAAGLRDIMVALLSGATVLPCDVKRASPRALAAWIEREEISVLGAVVTAFRPLLTEPSLTERFSSVRIVHLNSEPLNRQDVDRFRQRFPTACVLVSGYGATEAAPIVEHHIRHDTPLPAGRVPAGYPLDGIDVLLLDDDGRPVRPGLAGEVAGRSRYLADGYWRQPELTREAFLTDPEDPDARIYRTGDIGRWRSDGALELLGRKDHQVKVRGNRVHPGQIEAVLGDHEAVRETVVSADTDEQGDARLVAYVVAARTPPPHPGELRRFLQDRLPLFMTPSAFVVLDSIPTNANGKVDRAALPPAPPGPRLAEYEAPRSPLEHQVAAIFEELFGVRPIGANDDFFSLGGDSLLAAAVVGALEDTCGRSLAPSLLLEAPTVAAIAVALDGTGPAIDEPVTTLRAAGSRTPIFFVHNDRGRGLYAHGLGRALDPERPLYAIHLHSPGARPRADTVEGIAADRLRALRAARPRGPYVLGGHCYGGIVALEMARQLVEAGEVVEAVVMIDSPVPSRRARVVRRTSVALGRVVGLPPARHAALLATVDRAARSMSRRGRSAGLRLTAILPSGLRRHADAVARRLGRRSLDAYWQSIDEESLDPGWQAYCRAVRCHVPGIYHGRVALFRAAELPAERPDLGWSDLLPQVEVEVVPGDHHTCVTRHVVPFVERLEAVLDTQRS